MALAGVCAPWVLSNFYCSYIVSMRVCHVKNKLNYLTYPVLPVGLRSPAGILSYLSRTVNASHVHGVWQCGRDVTGVQYRQSLSVNTMLAKPKQGSSSALRRGHAHSVTRGRIGLTYFRQKHGGSYVYSDGHTGLGPFLLGSTSCRRTCLVSTF